MYKKCNCIKKLFKFEHHNLTLKLEHFSYNLIYPLFNKYIKTIGSKQTTPLGSTNSKCLMR